MKKVLMGAGLAIGVIGLAAAGFALYLKNFKIDFDYEEK